jgi:hypothetical protein
MASPAACLFPSQRLVQGVTYFLGQSGSIGVEKISSKLRNDCAGAYPTEYGAEGI